MVNSQRKGDDNTKNTYITKHMADTTLLD